MTKFDFEKVCSVIQNHRITFAYIVPPVVLLFGKHPAVDKYDLSSLRMLNCGAAPLTQELVKAVYERIKVPIKQGYGLSETGPTTHSQVCEQTNVTCAFLLTRCEVLGRLGQTNRGRGPAFGQPNSQIHGPE